LQIVSRPVVTARGRFSRAGLAVLLMPVATVLVHQLRYILTYGARAGRELTEQGDAYVHSLYPWFVALLPLFLGVLVVQLARSATSPRAERNSAPPRLWILWAGGFAALLVGYVAQEGLEVILGSAHTDFFTQAFGAGGWCVLPIAAAVAFAWALLARGTQAALRAVAGRAYAWRAATSVGKPAKRHFPKAPALAPHGSPLARRLAGRAPPFVVSLT
jgi:hypothetical protein